MVDGAVGSERRIGRGSGMAKSSKKKVSKPMLPRERCDFSAIVDRPPLKLPGGARACVLDHRQSRSLGHPQADGASGAGAADRHNARFPTCRIGAGTNTACGSASGASSICSSASTSGRRSRINARVCEDYPRVAEEAKQRCMGVHGPFLRTGADPYGARSEGNGRPLARRHRTLLRQTADRLARTRA